MRRNINHVVLPVDFTSIEDVELVVEQLQTFVKRLIPIRFGIVPMIHSDAAVEQAKIVYHLLETYGLGSVMSYLDIVSASASFFGRLLMTISSVFQEQKKGYRTEKQL